MFTFEIIVWYLGIIGIYWISTYFLTKQMLYSLMISILCVFVVSEFWEIPIHFMSYLGAPGYGSPHVLHHFIVMIMAVLLSVFSATSLNLRTLGFLAANLLICFVALLIFPGAVNSWILRSITVIVFFGVFIFPLSEESYREMFHTD